MHILFVTYEFVTEKKPCGGLGHYLANISSILADNGHQVTILVLTNHNSTFRWKNNIDVVTYVHNHISRKNRLGEYVEYFTRVNITERINRSLTVNDKINEMSRKHNIDIVQYCGDSKMLVWHRIKRIPSVVRLSSFGPWRDMASRLGTDMEDLSWLDTWESRIFLYSLTKADAIFAPSKFVARTVESKLKKNVKVIESPCIINDDIVISYGDKELIGEKYFLFYGRICVLKGIYVIKETIYEILEKNREFLFVFAGAEELKNTMQGIKRAAGEHQDRVIYLGDIRDSNRLYSIIKNAYACVLPSRADNLPNTCIEAMGLGKIVIGTYGASFEQLIRNKQNGLLIKRDSPRALMKAINYLMEMTEEERLAMGQKARERVEQMSPDKIYTQLISFYQETIEKKKKTLF